MQKLTNKIPFLVLKSLSNHSRSPRSDRHTNEAVNPLLVEINWTRLTSTTCKSKSATKPDQRINFNSLLYTAAAITTTVHVTFL